MLRRNLILIIGVLGTLIFGALFLLGTDACYVNEVCRVFRNLMLIDSLVVTEFFPCILILSLITYKMRDSVFHAWARFSYVWMPLSLIVILMSDDTPGHLFVSSQEFFAMLTWGLYILISLGIIGWKYLATRKSA